MAGATAAAHKDVLQAIVPLTLIVFHWNFSMHKRTPDPSVPGAAAGQSVWLREIKGRHNLSLK